MTKALSRGQKAAATRAMNKVAPIAQRQALLSAKVAKEKAAKAEAKREAAKVARADAKRSEKAKAPIYTLRAAAVNAIIGGVQASKIYSQALALAFPKFWEFTREQAKAKTNHGKLVTDYFAEIDLFSENFKSAHIKAGKPGRANPSAYIANFKKYAEADANPNADKGKGSGNKIDALAAFKRDLPALYLRANNADEFEKNPRLQEVARLAGMILAIVGADMQAINEKIGK